MSDLIKIISISSLVFLSLSCFQTGIFLCSGHGVKQNNRRTLIFIEFFTGFLLFFDALAYIYRGNISATGFYMVRLSNFFVFVSNFSIPFFFCFYACEFILQRRLNFSVVLHPKSAIKGGIPIQLFIVLFFSLSGIVLTIISQFTNFFYYFDDGNFYHRNTFYPLSVLLGILPGLITSTMLLQNRKKLSPNVLVSLLIYFALPFVGITLILFVYGFSWINISLGLGSLHLFFSSIKLMELEFYSGVREVEVLSPVYKLDNAPAASKEKVVRKHFWQTVSISLGGIILILTIVSITGVTIPKKTLEIEKPSSSNDYSKNVCVTFVRNGEKHWIDGNDPDRTGAQYDGVIFNNMKSTVITDWSFSILIPENCSVDPGAWNGTFTLSDGKLNANKPNEGDKENIHGEDFYTVTPMKTLGFGCIMYAPHGYMPLSQKIVFSYSGILKPFSNIIFDVVFALLVIVFIVATTISVIEGKLVRVEEENKKLEATVKERTKELESEKNRSENLLLNILPKEVAKELTEHPERTIAQDFPNATVLFTDIVGFTKMSGRMSADDVVKMLNKMISLFDERSKLEGIEKIKTIGDAYMAATGLVKENENDGAVKMISFAQGLLKDVEEFNKSSQIKIQIRIGINTGNLVAGVIGKTKFIYDIWGDTVNVASRMESTGEPMRIHISESTYFQAKDSYSFTDLVGIDVKGKGMMNTYFLK